MSEPYPLGEYYKVLEGFDIHRSANMWEAVVVVEDNQGRRHIRLYKWIQRGGKWKVDLARFSIGYWNIEAFAKKVNEFKAKYGVQSGGQERQGSTPDPREGASANPL